LHKFAFSILLSISILFANELVDALKGVKPQNRPVETTSNSIKRTGCDKSIVDAVSDNNLQFFRAKKESLEEINNCLIAGDMTPLMTAAYIDRPAIVKMFLDAGADANELNAKRYSALHFAAFYGNYEVVTLLLEKGANIDAVNDAGHTPLMIAASYGNAKTVGILISKGADVYIRDSSKQTARELAAKKGKKEVLAVMDKFRR